jgi:hypothetical protein
MFKMMADIELVHVPYRGGTALVADLIGGQVQVLFVGTETIEHIRSGKLRAIAVTTTTRLDLLPDIPTVGEFLPGFEASAWFGIGAPRNTPPDIIEKLNKEINAALADPKLGLPNLMARYFRDRPPTSASSSPRKPRSGATSSGPSTSRRTDAAVPIHIP